MEPMTPPLPPLAYLLAGKVMVHEAVVPLTDHVAVVPLFVQVAQLLVLIARMASSNPISARCALNPVWIDRSLSFIDWTLTAK